VPLRPYYEPEDERAQRDERDTERRTVECGFCAICCHWRFPISTIPTPSKPLCSAPVPLGLVKMLLCDLRISA